MVMIYAQILTLYRIGFDYSVSTNLLTSDPSLVTMTWTWDTISNFNWTRDTVDTTKFTITTDDQSLSGTTHTAKVSMYINASDVRESTFSMEFRKPPYFDTQLSEIYLRPGFEKNVTIPPATDDFGNTIYYSAAHDLPAGAYVDNTVQHGNIFEFKDITGAMSGTYELNISACISADWQEFGLYTIPIIINQIPSSGSVNSSYPFPADSSQSLSLVGMAVDSEGDDVSVGIFIL